MPNGQEPLIPWYIQADREVLGRWLDRALSEMRGYNSFVEIVTLVSEALGRFADREPDPTDDVEEVEQ